MPKSDYTVYYEVLGAEATTLHTKTLTADGSLFVRLSVALRTLLGMSDTDFATAVKSEVDESTRPFARHDEGRLKTCTTGSIESVLESKGVKSIDVNIEHQDLRTSSMSREQAASELTMWRNASTVVSLNPGWLKKEANPDWLKKD